MKFKVSAITATVLLMSMSQLLYAVPGPLFNVTTANNNLLIKTTIPHHNYPAAGIKIKAGNYTLAGIGVDCVLQPNGYCVFPVSDNQAHNISISGSGAKLDVTLCLNGKGEISCQNYNDLPASSPRAKSLYITNDSIASPVYVCSLDLDGNIGSCVQTGSGLITYPTVGIALNTDSTKAYLSVDDANNIFQCNINASDGTFASCVQTTMTNTNYTSGFYGGLITNTSNTYAYLVDNGSNSSSDNILVCPMVAGVIDATCATPAALANTGAGESITITKNGSTVYVADYSDGIYVCGTAGGGSSISSCLLKTGDGVLTFGSVSGVALNPSETLVYITAYDSGNVYACTTAPNVTNNFDHCIVAGSGMTSTASLTINAAGTKAYIGTFADHVYACSIKPDGSFDLPCVSTPGFNLAMGVALGY